MLRPLIPRIRLHHAVSTIIGGLIILILILTGVTAMVFVSQQYDQYQQAVNLMGQYESRQLSEDLVFNSPSMTVVTLPAIAGWGSGCTTTYNCYNISLSNFGGVTVQIMRIYINSTGSGCVYNPPSNYEQPCILNPSSTIAPYTFNQANQFVNTGETNHGVALALPKSLTGGLNVLLPNPNPAFPKNSIMIATSRGTVFSFEWPVPVQFYGQTISAFSSGVMKVAYVGMNGGGYSSSKEGAGSNGYCHTEAGQTLSGITGVMGKGVGVSGTTLTFVNPWVTSTILSSVAYDNRTSGPITTAYTQMYVYDIVTNTGQTSYVPTAGSIGLAWYSANHLDGPLIGIYYNGIFYSVTNPSAITALTNAGGIVPRSTYYAIYEVTIHYTSNAPSASVTFWGDASITNGSGQTGEDQTYFSGTLLLDGLWIRHESGSSCA